MIPKPPKARNLILIGARGCGKTSVGQELARRLAWTFIDTDQRIEAVAGRTIRDIFAQDGEPAFRRLETEAIAEGLRGQQQVFSVGGGAVRSAANRAALRAGGHCIWLTAPPEELYCRVQNDPSTATSRPPLTGLAGLDEARHLLAERAPLYAATAHCVVSTDGLSVVQVVEAVLAAI